MSIGTVFVSTGGTKVMRALRSLKRLDPDMPIYVQLDVSTNAWKRTSIPVETIAGQCSAVSVIHSNGVHVNGAFNQAVQWMKTLGHSHACLLHDDLVFSPLPENRNYYSRTYEQVMRLNASGFSFGQLEAHVGGLGGVRSPEDWDHTELESEEVWRVLCPKGIPARTAALPDFFVSYEESAEPLGKCTRLGPTGQIVSIAAWEKVGGFDEKYGTHYDGDFPAACALANLPPILCIPNTPALHLHNQSVAYGDPAVGLWSNVTAAFAAKYGTDAYTFFRAKGYPV
jgi:predicted CxxxxCH...CXXCH cytochrome family protein